MKKLLILIIAIIALMPFSSCDNRRPIYPESGVWVVVNLDWSELEENPNGATVRFYPKTRSELSVVTLRTNSSVDSAFVKRDNYAIVVMNETVDSHSNIEFSNSDNYENFVGRIKSVLNPSAGGDDIVTGGEPDAFATASYEDLEVTRESVIEAKRYELDFTPQLRTKQLCVTLYINGIDNLRSDIQALTIDGMADGIKLYTGESNGVGISHYLTFTEKVYDEDSYKRGYLRGYVNCFGVAGNGIDNKVTLYMALRDGNMHYIKDIDVTDMIYTDENDELKLYLDLEDITLPEVEDIYNPGSGFDAEVDDWDEEEDLNIPII
ncbi:MAG: DUF5119 domain-containing protein [Rikenellaceae bacterium]